MEPPPVQPLEYANLKLHSTAGCRATIYGLGAVIVVAGSAAGFFLRPGVTVDYVFATWGLFVVFPVLCVGAIVSGVRGLVYPTPYRRRAMVGIVLALVAMLGGLVLIGAIGRGHWWRVGS